MINLPEKIGSEIIDFKQFEGKNVIVMGKGTEVVEKFEDMKSVTKKTVDNLVENTEKGINVKLPNFVSLISINIKQ